MTESACIDDERNATVCRVVGDLDAVVRQRRGTSQPLRRRVTAAHVLTQPQRRFQWFQTTAAGRSQQLCVRGQGRSTRSTCSTQHTLPVAPGQPASSVSTGGQRGARRARGRSTVPAAESASVHQTTSVHCLTKPPPVMNDNGAHKLH